MNHCQRCQQAIDDHGIILFYRHPTQGRFMVQVCVACRDELRAGQPFNRPRQPVPAVFYKAFEGEPSL